MNSHQITHILPNGLKIVASRIQSLAAYAGVVVNAGSRDEAPHLLGLAHFVEHTIFKGTRSRSSAQISNRMESVGGELNAYTTKEHTMVYASAPAQYADRAIELLADLIANPSFPAKELEKEKDVVVEEIFSYRDSPAEAVYDDFEDLAYAGSSLAHNILGTPESVRALTPADCLNFVETLYTPGEMAMYVAGPDHPEKYILAATKRFESLCRPDSPRYRTTPPLPEPFRVDAPRDSHQANSIVGARVGSRLDPLRHAMALFNNYLGGPSMNSRLNRELRDRRGLVYTVDSSLALLSDTGLLSIYFGSDRKAVDKCSRIIAREIDRIAQSPLSPTAFEKVKRQYCGQLSMLTDHTEAMAMSAAKSFLFYGQPRPISYSVEQISQVTPVQLTEVARIVLPRLCRLSLL